VSNLLDSLKKAGKNFKVQTIVIDNNSQDGSLAYLKKHHPDVRYIQNKENIGFGRANNQAIKHAKGRYTLLINPDAILSEDTLGKLYEYMESNQNCGACGCKILKPDGSFAPESRRSIPTIGSALSKVLGLSALFPKSKLFGSYYLGWMDENESAQVPVLSGSFMFFRSNVLKQLEGFDERFFMYGEDIDLCYRLRKETNYTIDYVPETSIIHFKGQSSEQNSKRYLKSFNKALYLFFDKHYSSNYSLFFRMLVYLGVYLKWGVSALAMFYKKISPLFVDLTLLNGSLVGAFYLRVNLHDWPFSDANYVNFLWIHGIISTLYVMIYPIISKNNLSESNTSNSFRSTFLAFLALVVITFFARELAFSRLIIVYGFLISSISVIIYRIIANSYRARPGRGGKFASTKILIIGINETTAQIIDKIRNRVDLDYEITGIIAQNAEAKQGISQINGISVLGTLNNVRSVYESHQIDELFFILDTISYKTVLQKLTELRSYQPVAKLIPENMDYILGKSDLEYLDDMPLIDIHLSYFDLWNQLIKRSMDIVIAMAFCLVLSPLILPTILLRKKELKTYKENGFRITLLNPLVQHRFCNLYILMSHILRGNISLVGAPLFRRQNGQRYSYKRGLTGLIQVSRKKLKRKEEQEKFNLHYLQQYTIWLDFEILFKTFVNGPHPVDYIQKMLEKDSPESTKYAAQEP